MSFLVRAPGKLVLVGEYAVLDGAPALVMAIDRGVACAVALGGVEVVIETPDGDDRFVRGALFDAAPGRYTFSAWNPVEGIAGKPGFGGSAAACVAACVAAGRDPQAAHGLHRAVQGSGSGVDVAAAIHGGVIRYAAGQVRPMPPVRPVVVWTGASAKTGPRVERYLTFVGRAAFATRMGAVVDDFYADPIAVLGEAGDLLVGMARLAGIDYLTPAHAALRALARALGGAAKPSGAGGGDCAVALLPDAAAEAAFSRGVADLGLQVIPVQLAPGAHRVQGSAPTAPGQEAL